MKTSKNNWCGADFVGKNGTARFCNDDGTLVVHSFDHTMLLLWTMRIDETAPAIIFQTALEAAKAEAK